jgi:soluble lytic murein transglycosylase
MKPRRQLLLIFTGLLLLTFFIDQWRRARLERSQDKNILAASRKYGVDPALVKAVVWRESRFDPDAKGRKGEIGLMQVMPGTGQEWATATRVSNFSNFVLADPVRNIDSGTWYLARVLRRYTNADDPVPYALADYNAGRGNVLKWNKGHAATNSAEFIQQIGFRSTRDYVRSIMKRRERYIAWAAEQKDR